MRKAFVTDVDFMHGDWNIKVSRGQGADHTKEAAEAVHHMIENAPPEIAEALEMFCNALRQANGRPLLVEEDEP